MAILDESLISLSKAARLAPGRPHLSTVWRWATAGFRGIRLETVTVAGRRLTSAEALRRFFEATNRVGAPSDSLNGRPTIKTTDVLQRAGIISTSRGRESK